MTFRLGFCAAACTAVALAASSALAGTITFNANTSDPAPKAAFEELIAKFESENPDIDVVFNVFDHEAFKTSIRNFLVSEAPDVVTWFAGNRMKYFVDRGLFEDVSALWEEQGLKEAMASSMSALTIDGAQYGVPYAYYQWGIYYRKDIFEANGIAVPTTWDEFMAACETLKQAGVTPITIGTKYLWTAAGWFDYLNIRINGLPFHLELMDGKAAYSDERVRNVFAVWREMIEAGYFLEDHANYSWQEAQPFLFQGDAAMYLIGNFLVSFIPEEERDNYSFFQFPVIDPDVPLYEDAPTDTLHIPANAENKEDALRFLAFMARPDNQEFLNDAIEQLPPNGNAPIPDDRFLQAGFEMLNKAAGLAQFYDRDTDPDMARIGMEGFQEFMVNPDRLDAILERLDEERERIFN